MSRPAPQPDRLARADARVSRCHLCGAWTYRGSCATPHDLYRTTYRTT